MTLQQVIDKYLELFPKLNYGYPLEAPETLSPKDIDAIVYCGDECIGALLQHVLKDLMDVTQDS